MGHAAVSASEDVPVRMQQQNNRTTSAWPLSEPHARHACRRAYEPHARARAARTHTRARKHRLTMGLSEKDEQHGEDRGGPKLRCHEHATCNRATCSRATCNLLRTTCNRATCCVKDTRCDIQLGRARFGRQHEHEYGRGSILQASLARRGGMAAPRDLPSLFTAAAGWLHGCCMVARFVCCMLRSGGRSIRSSSSRKRCATGCTRRTGGSRCRHVRVRPHALQKSQAWRQSRRYHGVRACVCSCALAFG